MGRNFSAKRSLPPRAISRLLHHYPLAYLEGLKLDLTLAHRVHRHASQHQSGQMSTRFAVMHLGIHALLRSPYTALCMWPLSTMRSGIYLLWPACVRTPVWEPKPSGTFPQWPLVFFNLPVPFLSTRRALLEAFFALSVVSSVVFVALFFSLAATFLCEKTSPFFLLHVRFDSRQAGSYSLYYSSQVFPSSVN